MSRSRSRTVDIAIVDNMRVYNYLISLGRTIIKSIIRHQVQSSIVKEAHHSLDLLETLFNPFNRFSTYWLFFFVCYSRSIRLTFPSDIYLVEFALFQDFTSHDSRIPVNEPSRLEVLKVSRVASTGSSYSFYEPRSSSKNSRILCSFYLKLANLFS